MSNHFQLLLPSISRNHSVDDNLSNGFVLIPAEQKRCWHCTENDIV